MKNVYWGRSGDRSWKAVLDWHEVRTLNSNLRQGERKGRTWLRGIGEKKDTVLTKVCSQQISAKAMAE